MSQKTLRIVHLVYGIALSLLLLITAVLFIVSCIEIYQSGARPFSRESIAEAFEAIAIPVYLTVAGIAGGALLSLLLPLPKTKAKAVRDELDTLERLKRKLGGRIESREPAFRLALRVGAAAVAVALGIYPALCFLDPSRFTLKDVNGSVIASALPVLIWAAIVIALSTVSSLLSARSARRECDAYKRALVEGRKAPPSPSGAERTAWAAVRRALGERKAGILLALRLTLLLVAVAFIVLGVWNGGADDVLGKAIRICTECIGLG